MTILDTDVLSALMQNTPDESVVQWLDRQSRNSIWITSVTVLEIRFGLQIMAAGRRKMALSAALEATLRVIGQQVLNFDREAAEQAGDLMASRQRRGRPGDLRDTMIAGIVLAQNATLATRNTTHFADLDVPLVNPWTQQPSR